MYLASAAVGCFTAILLCFVGWSVSAQDTCNTTCSSSPTTSYAFRLHPGQDLYNEIHNFALEQNLQAAFVQTVVGSLMHVSIRLANQPAVTQFPGPMEIVSLVGTISPPPYGPHLHISVAFSDGSMVGGHLEAGNSIYTTAEVVIAEMPKLKFQRPVDPQTTWDELEICCR